MKLIIEYTVKGKEETGAEPWGRKTGRSEEKEPNDKDGGADDDEDEDEALKSRLLLPRPPPGLKLSAV